MYIHVRVLCLFFLPPYSIAIITLTSFRERKEKKEWFPSVPDSVKLKDTDIDAFVKCLLPLLKMAMFSKVGSADAASTYHNLALIRPEMVLPDLLDR